MRMVPGRFTPVCRSRCGTRGRSAAPAPGGSYGGWDHSPCVWFFVCGPIEMTLPTGLWDQQRRARSECECGCGCYCECARECECECVSGIFQMRWVARRFTPVCRRRRGAGGVPAPGGSYVVWDHSPCVWFCLCRPIERTLPTGLWDQQRRVRSECECECECGCACYCECARECECECVSGIFQMRWVPRRFTPVCRSRCGAGGADRGPGAGRFVRDLGPLPLCVALLVQANRNGTSDRDLGPAAESTL